MNWDWDKLQEKRQRQTGWKPDSQDREEERRQPDDDGPETRRAPEPKRSQGPRRQVTDPLGALRKVKIPGGAKWLILAAVVVWLLTGIYIVQPDEAGVVLRFGAYSHTTGAGPHYHLPWPIEEVYLPKVTKVQQAEVGFRSSQGAGGAFQQGRVQPVEDEAAMLTGDENIINIQFSIQYRIKPDGAVEYLFNVVRPDAVVKNAAEAAMREVIGNSDIDAALTDGKIKIQNDVATLLQSILDRYKVGVEVVGIQMQDVQPPREVSDAFKDVASAREDRVRIINEAEAYSNEVLPKARGVAAEMVNQAQGYKQSRILAAEGESQRFLSVLAEYEKAQDVTRKRLLYETLESILSQPGMEKLVLPSGVSDKTLPLLPLNLGAGNAAASQTPSAFSNNTAEAPAQESGRTIQGARQ